MDTKTKEKIYEEFTNNPEADSHEVANKYNVSVRSVAGIKGWVPGSITNDDIRRYLKKHGPTMRSSEAAKVLGVSAHRIAGVKANITKNHEWPSENRVVLISNNRLIKDIGGKKAQEIFEKYGS